MAIFYTRNEKLIGPLQAGHEFVKEFSIRCWDSKTEEYRDVPQFQYRHAVGKVVRTWEHNGYHDSDFYAEYLAEDGTFSTTEYATTRFPCNGCGAVVDATDEVVELYAAHCEWLAEEKRKAQERRDAEKANEWQITVDELKKLRNAYGGKTLEACGRLLKTKNFRSDFRRSLCKQLRDWLAAENPQYPSPFSPRQLECLR